ncbi:hypothetical protein MAM1_0009d01044 [Mucor ambiguus]|uniref:Uncharacterized protein n=1 Tax=Mucor ambiguus TaxID=91626 RepID=A0A0C9LQP3_9FUNG|nr:hypothetical protein MAM1_0009d01044 [Mucor ambiguus]
MHFDLKSISHSIEAGCVIALQCFLLFFFPLGELIRRMRAQRAEYSKITTRLEIFERNVTTLLANRINSNSNASIGAKIVTTNANEYENGTNISVTNSSNIAWTSSKAGISQFSSVSPPSNRQTLPDILTGNANHLHMQLNETALDLSNKVDNLQEVNRALKAQVVALEGQLQEQRNKTDKTRNLMANRLEVLEGYIQSGAKLEDQRAQENQQVQALSQKNTHFLNQRTGTLEEQIRTYFKESEDRRSKELQSLVITSESLSKLCEGIKIKLDKQAQVAAEHDKEIVENTETIRNTFSSDALAGLGQGVRDALDMCESKLVKMEQDHEKMQTILGETSNKFKIANNTLASMQKKFQTLRENISAEVTDVSGKLGKLSEKNSRMRLDLALSLIFCTLKTIKAIPTLSNK